MSHCNDRDRFQDVGRAYLCTPVSILPVRMCLAKLASATKVRAYAPHAIGRATKAARDAGIAAAMPAIDKLSTCMMIVRVWSIEARRHFMQVCRLHGHIHGPIVHNRGYIFHADKPNTRYTITAAGAYLHTQQCLAFYTPTTDC